MRKAFRVTKDMRSRDRLTAALAYAKAGYPVLALFGARNGKCDCGKSDCNSPGKHPIGAEFPRGYRDATTDPKRLRNVFAKYPRANIGLVPCDGLLIVDVDGSIGESSIGGLSLPETASVKTGRGRHLYFLVDDLPNWTPPKLKGVDFRYESNGYVVAPSSRHVNGDRYEWVDEWNEAASVTSIALNGKRSIKIDFSSHHAILNEGNRNSGLAKIAGSLRAKNLPKSAVAAALLAINHETCKPPLPDDEVEKIARSIGRYPTPVEDSFGNMSEVVAEAVRWLYPPYLPRGAVTVIDGDPGLGKSSFTIAIAAALTAGRSVPWSQRCPKGKVLILSAEDDPARVQKPRLDANGADTRKIRYARELFTLDDAGIELLRLEVETSRPDFVIIDPIIAFMGVHSDLNKATDMTRFLTDIDKIARAFDCAILLVRHLRKSREGGAVYQGLFPVSTPETN